MKENKKEKSLNKIKEKKVSKFIEMIKKRWLVDGTKTVLLVAIIVVIFIAINSFMQKINLTPIDVSQDKINTLTQESKEKVKNIDKDVNIYFIGFSEDDENFNLAKLYNKANDKIKTELVDINNRLDLVQKYGIENDSTGIIIECGEKSKVLTEQDLVTYDMSTYETINIAEEKLTSSIMSIVSDKIPKIYFLDGYSDTFSLQKSMSLLNILLENEVCEVTSLNVISTGKIPDDCDTLVITTPSKDFDDIATNSIINYINSGRNILWLNAAQTQTLNLSNVNKILALYAVNPFEKGCIIENDIEDMISNSKGESIPNYIVPEVEYSEILKDVYNTIGAVLFNATKINVNDDKLEEQKVEMQELLTTSENAHFITDFNNIQNTKTEEEGNKFIVGAELEKIIKEADEENNQEKIVSKLIIYGENAFITDFMMTNDSYTPAIYYNKNKDIILNSLAYLVDRPEDIVARKSTGTVTYTATAKQDLNVRIIIFAVPILIIILGIIVWQVRRRKK